MKLKAILSARSVLPATALLMSSCTFWYDTVSFDPAGKVPAATTPVPKIEVDTNITVATLFGGSVKSKKPYDIRAYHLDDTSTFAAAEFTDMTVTYADGTVDPGVAALGLPKRFQHAIHESHNSMAGGAVVVTRSRIIAAEFPGAVTRDEPFTLRIEGKFTKDDGTTIPFVIRQKYDISRDTRKESWADFVSGA